MCTSVKYIIAPLKKAEQNTPTCYPISIRYTSKQQTASWNALLVDYSFKVICLALSIQLYLSLQDDWW